MQTVTGENMKQVLDEQVIKSARLMTDELNVYVKPGKDFASHETVAHGEKEYVRGDVHINTAEGFFPQLKRSIDETHHHVLAHHLHRYVDEFDYHYNTRKIEDCDRTKKRSRAEGNMKLLECMCCILWQI